MEILLILIIFVVSVFVIRLFGAWMLRINDVIENQKELLKINRAMLSELQNLNTKGLNGDSTDDFQG